MVVLDLITSLHWLLTCSDPGCAANEATSVQMYSGCVGVVWHVTWLPTDGEFLCRTTEAVGLSDPVVGPQGVTTSCWPGSKDWWEFVAERPRRTFGFVRICGDWFYKLTDAGELTSQKASQYCFCLFALKRSQLFSANNPPGGSIKPRDIFLLECFNPVCPCSWRFHLHLTWRVLFVLYPVEDDLSSLSSIQPGSSADPQLSNRTKEQYADISCLDVFIRLNEAWKDF